MMMPTQQEFAAAYDKAPQYVKDFIAGDELTSVFEAIREEYKLHLDDAGVLADLLNAVILELMPLGGFEAAVAEHIPNITQEARITLTRAVNEKIFSVLRSRAKPEVVAPTPLPPVPPPVTTPTTVVTQKLVAPIGEVPKEVVVPMPQEPSRPGGVDPYREPIE